MNDSNQLKENTTTDINDRPLWQRTAIFIIVMLVMLALGFVVGRFIGGMF